MRRLSAIAALLAALMASPSNAQSAAPVSDILSNTLIEYARPAYNDLAASSTGLLGSAKLLCQSPSGENLKATQAAFKGVVSSWSKVEWFRVGAVMNDNRIERMYYFPDRKGSGLKQVQSALATQDVNAASPQLLASKSVAMQGLGAAEFLLFGTGSETLTSTDGAYRCSYVAASAATLSSISNNLSAGWVDKTEVAKAWQKPAADNPYFRNDAEALNVMIGTLIHGLEAVKDMRLAAFIGKTPEADKPKLSAYWRSDTTFASIAANLEGLQNLYTGSNIQTVLPSGNDALLRTIKFDFSQAIRAAKALDMPVASVLSESDLRKKAVYLQLTVQILIDHFNTEFAIAAGLDAGFSFGDGD